VHRKRGRVDEERDRVVLESENVIYFEKKF